MGRLSPYLVKAHAQEERRATRLGECGQHLQRRHAVVPKRVVRPAHALRQLAVRAALLAGDARRLGQYLLEICVVQDARQGRQ